MLANAKNGVSSYEIHRALGVTQKTAWFMNHRIRAAMQTKTFAKLSGQIEADETYVGGKAKNMHTNRRKAIGTGGAGKTIVMGLLDRGGDVVTTIIPDTTRPSIQKVVRDNVEKRSDLFTDAHSGYDGLAPDNNHQAVDHMKEYVRGQVHTNNIENFWALWKRCIKGTHVHLSSDHILRYLDEEAFRFNNRKTNDARFLLAANSAVGHRLTYENLAQQSLKN
jgi:transposase-like protein